MEEKRVKLKTGLEYEMKLKERKNTRKTQKNPDLVQTFFLPVMLCDPTDIIWR